MKRIITLIAGFILFSSAIWANKEYDVTLEKGDLDGQTIELPYGSITFRLVEYGSYHRVLVTIDNTTMSQAMLLFKRSEGEKALKKNKPKIEFEKTYPGSKGNRSVYGCKELNQSFVSIIPQEKYDQLGFNVSSTTVTKLELPVYMAKYDPKQLIKKGAYNVSYKILSEEVLQFNFEVKGWTEDDPEYVATREAVDVFLSEVDDATFCDNPKHDPVLAEQQRPFLEKQSALVKAIEDIVKKNDWMSDTAPFQAYKAMRDRLESVNLSARTQDCGAHKVPKVHGCGYCRLSAQQIYHQLDDLYQQLRVGKLSKVEALKKAQGLYNCYQSSRKRKKDASYDKKISKFYDSISNY